MSGTYWRKSTFSNQGECVEVAPAVEEVLVRDTKDREGGTISLPGEAWKAFLENL
jgi:hypothetical protein